MSLTIIQRCVLSKCRSNINFDVCRRFGSVLIVSSNNTMFSHLVKLDTRLMRSTFLHTSKVQHDNIGKSFPSKLQENYPGLQIKRPAKVKKLLTNGEKSGIWNVKAMVSAEEYDLEGIVEGLKEQDLYKPNTISTTTTAFPDVIHAMAKYEIEYEPREIFFFREGAVVMWNISELESGNILRFLKKYEEHPYADTLVESESEIMSYSYTDRGKESHLKDGDIMLASSASNLDKYTFSNAMAQSVKLGIWEASLNHYIDSIEFITEDLKNGRKLRMSQSEVLRKQGELFALRHSINLSSDLLDTPDFYWDRDNLEQLYHQTCGYFSIAKRTRVINEKLNHCVELVGIVSSHLSDRHHIRLEWMIIVLIMVEVAFETLHYIDRYFS